MEIKTNTFYKARQTATVNGKAVQTPGGYLYVAGAGDGKVAVIMCEREELPKEGEHLLSVRQILRESRRAKDVQRMDKLLHVGRL